MIATQAVVMAGVRIGRDSLVGASAMVNKDVEPESVVVGFPAKRLASVRDIKSTLTGEPADPWREHFDRGMPWQGVGYEQWSQQRHDAAAAVARHG